MTARKHLTESEVAALIKAIAKMRYAERDRAMCTLMFRHGLRVSELCALSLTDLHLGEGRLYVRRLKGSLSTTHPLAGSTMRALRRWLARRPDSGYRELFLSERDDPFTPGGVRYLVAAWGEHAKIPFRVHPHMLRHACGYALVNRPGANVRAIQDYLGHRDPKHTARYTEISPKRFEELWGD